MSFFFSQQNNKKFQDVELLHKLGCKLCPLYSGNAKTKDMLPVGSIKPDILLLGQNPGQTDDAVGKPFTGPSGEYLRSNFLEDQWKRIRINNIVRTATPNDREPTPTETECCRISIENDIILYKPKAIFAFGGLALNWFLQQDKSPSINAWRGHRFSHQIKDHKFWVFPMFHPAYILRSWYLDPVFKLDIKNAYKFLSRNLEPEVVDISTVHDNCNFLYKIEDIRQGLNKLFKEPEIEIDIENIPVRPYNPQRRILSIALGTSKYAIAFPWQHSKFQYRPGEFEQIRKLVHIFLKNKKQVKVAHNASHEVENFIVEFDDPTIAYCNWKDTMSSGYCLNYGGNAKTSESDKDGKTERLFKGLLSLDSLSKVYLGIFLKSLSKINVEHLDKYPIDQVLRYNVLDVKLGHLISQKLDADIEYEGLQNIRWEHDRRVPTATLTQWKGLVTSESQAREHAARIQNRLDLIHKNVYNNIDVVAFISKFSTFNIASWENVADLFYSLKFKVTKTVKDGKTFKEVKSSDDLVLKAIDHPVAKLIIEYRELSKLKSTYVDIFIPESENYIVYPDGKLHPQFTTHFTTTGRFSSREPNCQNMPKKKNKEIKNIVVAPAGHIQASFDFGQIEYRVIVMVSKDPKLIDYVKNNKDIHSDWALKIAKKYSQRVGKNTAAKWLDSDIKHLKDEDKIFSAFRDIVKNAFVFASFFGAGDKKLAEGMNIPQNIMKELHAEFWAEFAGAKIWQDNSYAFYNEHGYIANLNGRRRYAPMEAGEIPNTQIQGSAADIMADAMNRISEYGIQTHQHQFVACNTIHDDLQYYLPINTWRQDSKFIIKEMLSCKYPWINVPLAVEAAAGLNWLSMEKIGTFTSDKLDDIDTIVNNKILQNII